MNDFGDVQGEIGFHHVSLYECHRTVLEDVHLTIPAHSTVAIVGRSASEKAALASLVPRFRDPSEGTITIDGIDVRTICLESLRRQVFKTTLGCDLFQTSILHSLKLDSPILILEEAVAELDSRSEFYIQEVLKRLTRGRTTLMITRRLSWIRSADEVVVLEAGKMVERGPPELLEALGGRYAELHDKEKYRKTKRLLAEEKAAF